MCKFIVEQACVIADPTLRISAIPGSAFSLISGGISERCRAVFQRDAGHTLSPHMTVPMVACLPGIV